MYLGWHFTCKVKNVLINKNYATTAPMDWFKLFFVSQNSKCVGRNEATEMPPSLPPPHYGNNLRLNAPTSVNKQAPVHREASTDIHIQIVNADEDVLNPFSQFSRDSLQFPSIGNTQQRIPLWSNVNNGTALEKSLPEARISPDFVCSCWKPTERYYKLKYVKENCCLESPQTKFVMRRD